VQGWDYAWTDLAGNPITQLVVGPLASPMVMTSQSNLRLVGSGLPTCTRMQDTLHLTATLVSTPTVVAVSAPLVEVMPDPTLCDVVDVGIVQTATTTALNAGQWVTFALTVTNYMTVPVSAVVTDTLSPAAIKDQPARGCTQRDDDHGPCEYRLETR
jgi:uncharacterized repeat protein (TIGR01451 family)